jgi:hypothetical protein
VGLREEFHGTIILEYEPMKILDRVLSEGTYFEFKKRKGEHGRMERPFEIFHGGLCTGPSAIYLDQAVTSLLVSCLSPAYLPYTCKPR